jgi:hypothetical protein
VVGNDAETSSLRPPRLGGNRENLSGIGRIPNQRCCPARPSGRTLTWIAGNSAGMAGARAGYGRLVGQGGAGAAIDLRAEIVLTVDREWRRPWTRGRSKATPPSITGPTDGNYQRGPSSRSRSGSPSRQAREPCAQVPPRRCEPPSHESPAEFGPTFERHWFPAFQTKRLEAEHLLLQQSAPCVSRPPAPAASPRDRRQTPRRTACEWG